MECSTWSDIRSPDMRSVGQWTFLFIAVGRTAKRKVSVARSPDIEDSLHTRAGSYSLSRKSQASREWYCEWLNV